MDRIADYQFIQPLGEGSSGKYFLAATPPRLGIAAEHVAVKVLQVSAGEEAFHRLTRELRTFAKVRSAHLVTLYDAGQEAGQCYYAMEYCPGGSLAYPVREVTRESAVAAVAAAARAAHDLHEAGIAHRDLRPGNILLRSDGSACLGDLGLAQLGSGSVTSMAPMASIGFVDPKLITGDTASRASDVYSLGAVLHWALTGKHIHPGVEGVDPMMAVRSVLRQPPHVERELLTAEEADLILACTSANVEQRPATALEVAVLIEALERQ